MATISSQLFTDHKLYIVAFPHFAQIESVQHSCGICVLIIQTGEPQGKTVSKKGKKEILKISTSRQAKFKSFSLSSQKTFTSRQKTTITVPSHTSKLSVLCIFIIQLFHQLSVILNSDWSIIAFSNLAHMTFILLGNTKIELLNNVHAALFSIQHNYNDGHCQAPK